MVVTITPALMKSRTGYTMDVTVLGYLIDDAIRYVNQEAGTNCAVLAAGTTTVSDNESTAIIPLITLLMRAYHDKGSSAISAISMTSMTSDPQYSLHMKLVNKGIDRLRGRNFERV